MRGFKVCDCSRKQRHSHTHTIEKVERVEKETTIVNRSVLDDMLCHKSIKPESIFVFDGKEWVTRNKRKLFSDLECDLLKRIDKIEDRKIIQNGITGPKEDRGYMGFMGIQGYDGEKGDRGLRGFTGPRGPLGPEGPMGIQGFMGRRGEKGDRGPRGFHGYRGPTGPSSLFKDVDNKTGNMRMGFNSGTGGIMNTFYGYFSGNNEQSSENTYIGHLSGKESKSIGGNVLIGNRAGFSSNGAQNTYVGDSVCSEATSNGSYNTFIGAESGMNVTSGYANTFIGTVSGFSNKDGNWNVYLGQSAGNQDVNGCQNVFVGANTANTSLEANNCIIIGEGADTSSEAPINQIVIGQGVIGKGDNTITFPENLISFGGGTEVNFSSSNGGCLYPVSSSKRWKDDIKNISEKVDTENLYKLRPVVFRPKNKIGKSDIDIGLIAEEVNEHLPILVPKDSNDKPASVRYSLLSVLTIAELKKLKNRLDKLETPKA